MPSSVVRNINYDAKSATLRVNFVSGMIYDYKKVPEKVYLGMKNAPSKGTYLNKHIKGLYIFEKISPG